VIAANPDAVFIGAAGNPAPISHAELKRNGFKDVIYHTCAAANQAFLQMGGENLNEAALPVGPFWFGISSPIATLQRK
jgi:branched-chain amino acid transport system substrate-binding protein